MPALSLALSLGTSVSPAVVRPPGERTGILVQALDLAGADEITVVVEGANLNTDCWWALDTPRILTQGQVASWDLRGVPGWVRLRLTVSAPPGWSALARCRVALPGRIVPVVPSEEERRSEAVEFVQGWLAACGLAGLGLHRRGPVLML